MISMALFHAAYDLAYIYAYPLPWFTQGIFQDIWRASISWIFLFIAGWMCSFSNNNLRRAAKYGITACIVWLTTTFVSIDDPINFGIIYCMAACTLAVVLAKPILEKMPPLPAIVVFLFAFGLTWNLPHHVYALSGFAWLGFPGPGFVSGDYYPLIPFVFMYLAGYMASRLFDRTLRGYPKWMNAHPLPALEALGRHALPFYLLHQPIILLLLKFGYSVL